ncbi:GlcNAc-transferase family protein [Candidatus Palauibacter sp.]|uniref:GlcNAc-transferase family protein n=1 Tax=Candidatus Palauibacter sp. TaxID=3101350 RepID=UPI003CC607CF
MADVHVQIPSLNDPETPKTVRSLLDRPGLAVRVTVILQSDDAALREAVVRAGADVRWVRLAKSRGCGWARVLAAAAWDGEPWVMGVDAHTLAEPGWAANLAREAEQVGRGVLTTYPTNWGQPVRPTVMRLNKWPRPERPSFIGQVVDPGSPSPSRAWAAGFWFAPAEWQREVPPDPAAHYGTAEHLTAVRTWTNGWDLFHPGVAIVQHRYSRGDRTMWWTDREGWHAPLAAAQKLAAAVLAEGATGPYGLGTVRTLSEWEAWSGMRQSDQTFEPEDQWRARVEPGARG